MCTTLLSFKMVIFQVFYCYEQLNGMMCVNNEFDFGTGLSCGNQFLTNILEYFGTSATMYLAKQA